MKIESEDFAAWRDNPVTQVVFDALARYEARAKERWIQASWAGGNPDPLLLADLRARAETAADLRTISIEDLETLEDTIDGKPERNLPDRIQGSDPAGEDRG